MSRPIHPGLLLGGIAIASFLAGVLIEPLFERPASALVPKHKAVAQPEPMKSAKAPAALPAKIELIAPAPVAATPAAVEAAPTEPDPDSEDAPPSTVLGADPDSHVDYIEMKNAPAEDGQGEPARDVDMIDEPRQPAGDAADAVAPKDVGAEGERATESPAN